MSPTMLLPAGVGPDDERWHQVRRQGIGASEIAAVMGLSPWESAFSMFWRKREGWTVDATDEMRTGTRLEPVIADWWADQHADDYAIGDVAVFAHSERPWQIASPDRFVYGSVFTQDAVLECKWTGRWDGWGDPGTDDIPVYYRTQVLWQCDVMDVPEWHVAVLGPGGFRAYHGQRHEADLVLMREAGRRFMDRLAAGTPPDIDDHTATTAALKRLNPEDPDGDVTVDIDFAEAYRRARVLKARATALVDRYDNRARAILGDAKRLMCNNKLVVSRSVYERKPYEVGPATVDKLNPGRADSYAN